ncbi:hypothetical protein FOL46_009557 [Perkinsus olseni]|uniref:Uncharacterized protein n=2 Tax=Perkinsus olseni TaxID=32597 RepID=A0A7J6L0H6_PEROL|nr:hypothetical protein FOL46_009557 [Perkinsus olseni]
MSPLLLYYLIVVGGSRAAFGQGNDACQQCCSALKVEAGILCEVNTKGLVRFADCIWQDMVSAQCFTDCNNCTSMAYEIKQSCLNTLSELGNPSISESTCDNVRVTFNSECEDACSMDPLFCLTDTANYCMNNCGNYYPCRCYQIKGTMRYECYGTTVRQQHQNGIVEPYGDGGGSQSNAAAAAFEGTCNDILPAYSPTTAALCGDGGICHNHRRCPINHCTVRDITCIRPNECYTLDGTCDTQTGECLFDKQPEGTLCDDGLFYTINDTCIDGQCIGTADICKKLDITCNPPNPCLLPGTCTPTTGDCIYPRKPTGSQCDDGRSNTINDVCVDGLCLGTPTDICQVNGINCRPPTECHNEGTCNPVDGTCTFDDVKPDGYPCNDGSGKCIAGICSISDDSYDHESYTEGFHMIGIGACSDEDGNIPSGYYKGTGSSSSSRGGYEVCRGWCLQDISCIAFGWIPWTGNMCIIYTHIRDRPPPPSSVSSSSLTDASNDDDWQWIDGDSDYSRNNKDIVKTVMATTDDTVSTGQQHRPYEECWVKVLRRGGGVGADDTVEDGLGMKAGSYGPFITLLLILLISMLWLLYRVKYKRRLKDALHTRTATIKKTTRNILGSLIKDTAVYLGSKAMHHG